MNVKHEPKKQSKNEDNHQPTAQKTDSLEETETSITLRGIPRIPAAVYHLFLPHPVLDAQLVQLTPTRYDNSKGMNRSHREIARAHNEGLLPTLVNNPLISSMLLSRVPFWRHTGALDLVLSMVLTIGLADHECPAKHEWMTSSSNPGLSLDGVGIETHECRHPLSAIVFCCSKSLLPSSRIRLLEGWSRSDRGIVPKDVDERLKRSKGHPSSPLSSLQRHPHPRWNYCGIPSSDVMKYYHEEQATGNCETSADVVSATALLSDTLLTLTSEMNQRLARRGTTSIDYGAIADKDESSRTGTARPSIYSSLRSSFVNSDLVYDSDDTDFVLVSNGSWNIKDQEMMSESPSAPIPLLLVVVPPFDKQQKQENGGKCTIGDFVFNDAVKPLIERLEPYCGNPVLSKSPLTHQSLLCRVLMLQCSSDLSFSPLAEAYFDLVDSISAISCGTVEKRSWSQQRCGIVDVDPMTSSAVGYVVMDLIGSGSAVSSA